MSNSPEYSTAQESFWAGRFGDEYIDRNIDPALLASNLALFSRVLRHADRWDTCIELGANVGMNLRALQLLKPDAELFGVEINERASVALREAIPAERIYNQSILEFASTRTWDLVLVKGVLIHLNPEVLPDVYSLMHRSSSRFIVIAEYYNPTPVSVTYRGHSDRLFKRDFAGEMLDAYPDLTLLDYGFTYHRDANFPQDDISWFLLEKQTGVGL